MMQLQQYGGEALLVEPGLLKPRRGILVLPQLRVKMEK